jgi:excisionase family DNA binding protein
VIRLMSLSETAQLLHVSRRTLFRLMAAGRLRPIHPTPGRTVFTEREVNAYLASLERRVA